MLQKVEYDDDVGGEGLGHLLRPLFYWELLKRRVFYFTIPFVLITSVGVGLALLWPPIYVSEGKILVQSQQIPTELVRPTVTNAAQERIQVIEQRTMTRENLLAIIDKFQLFPDQRNLMSVTQLVDAMRKKTKIEAIAQPLTFRSASQNPTIVFTVGYEDSDPATAAKVANELVTHILNEDLRDRTNRATDTTKFLAREMQRLQSENAAIEAKVAEAKAAQLKPNSSDQPSSQLAQLRAELIQKRAFYSDRHPTMQSIKRQIEALEKLATPTTQGGAGAGVEALEAQQAIVQKNLEVASSKFAAARMGESLERDQQSEKLEVIEQPAVPQEPTRPNRPKIAGLALLLGFAAGAGLTFLLEMTDSTIRRSSDIFNLVDSQLVIAIPYIVTEDEIVRKKARLRIVLIATAAGLAILLIGGYLFMPPLDLMIAKARVGLFR